MFLVLNRTKVGLLIRAGVENGEMVEALGYRIRRLFVGVFMAGSALAGLGGVLWGLYKETLTAAIGGEMTVLVFIVIIIGGLGSVGGCFIGAMLVALVANYAGFLAPKIALVSNILLMVAILLWRPQGLYPVAKRDDLTDCSPATCPRSRLRSAMLLAIVVGLALAPFLFPGARALNVAATICVFVVLVASYDLLLGYTGIVSFAHTMFYGIGAYGVGLAAHGVGPTWGAVFMVD
jgi:ABC-type branched-subunit amino acid transport system permease subunit